MIGRTAQRAEGWALESRTTIYELNAEPARTVFLCGARRSGTTWAAAFANHAHAMRLMFEPFDAEHVQHSRAFARLLHIAPDDPAPEHAEAAHAIMTGRVRDPWIDRFARPGRYTRRLIKDVNAHFFLGWLARRHPGARFVLLVRHPFSSALSKAAVPGFLGLGATRDLLRQERLCETHLADQLAVVRAARPGLEADMCVWAAQLRVALRELPADAVHVAFYESLRLEPHTSVPALLEALGVQAPEGSARDGLFAAWGAPSATTRPDSPVRGGGGLDEWRKALDADERRRARAVLDAFGLDELYGEGLQPRREVIDAVRSA